ncbi:DJ-1/PfpI family protein [Microbacterium aerolatum]|uniref:DJ-1/PfpI family protein n=1 Tax=Microbacterium aerolatum TaxID=153731 RepID=UPI002001327F|nr:DJ-1/PfpI family protein [Microbacterium aerolatum]MCK3769943.1 DJ-1/PfpI family protein [Microbacterium aerolatum]
MTGHDPISQHLQDSMNHWGSGTDDPAMQQAMERSIAAHHALATSPGVTFEAHEDIVIVLHPGFELLDMVGPYHFLAAMIGATMHLATTGDVTEPVRSSSGMPITPTTTLDDAPSAPTVLLIPGGETGVLTSDTHAINAIRRLGQNAELITSVCSGSLALAAAGLLEGRRATSHWSVRHLLPGHGAIEVDERVVEDGNVLTAAGVTAGMDLAIRLVARFRGDTYARFLELGAEYDPQPPFGSGTPDQAGPELTALSRDFLAPLEEQLRAP